MRSPTHRSTVPATILTMVVTGLVFGVGWFVGLPLVEPELRGPQLAIGAVVGGLFFGVLFGGWLGRQRRAAGPASADRSFRRALRTGVLPPGVDTVAWRRSVGHRRAVTLRQQRFGPLVFGGGTVLYVALALTQDPLWWLAAAVFAGFLVAALVQTPRLLRTTAALLDELDRREADRTT
ncbi:hypothetical protein [Curtobacterium sp. SGAir0471]|uniref:hypothetical protein n=1 Tax=Curtobacterium sp. SGAir0471 TaxID=2070337 RepID=UPI0010F76191|nr:hypothetical protein [Curtobacterium sp. SGAir0471]